MSEFDPLGGGMDTPSALAFVDYSAMLKDIMNVFKTNKAIDRQKVSDITRRASQRLSDEEKGVAIAGARRQHSKQLAVDNAMTAEFEKKVGLNSTAFDEAMASKDIGMAMFTAGNLSGQVGLGFNYSQFAAQMAQAQKDGSQESAESVLRSMEKINGLWHLRGNSPLAEKEIGRMYMALNKQSIPVQGNFSGKAMDEMLHGREFKEGEVPTISYLELWQEAKGTGIVADEARDIIAKKSRGSLTQATADMLGAHVVDDPIFFDQVKLLKYGSPEEREYSLATKQLEEFQSTNGILDRSVAHGLLKQENQRYQDWIAQGNTGPKSTFLKQEAQIQAASDERLILARMQESGNFNPNDSSLAISMARAISTGGSVEDIGRNFALNVAAFTKGIVDSQKPLVDKVTNLTTELAGIDSKLTKIEDARFAGDLPESPTVAEMGLAIHGSIKDIDIALVDKDIPESVKAGLEKQREELLYLDAAFNRDLPQDPRIGKKVTKNKLKHNQSLGQEFATEAFGIGKHRTTLLSAAAGSAKNALLEAAGAGSFTELFTGIPLDETEVDMAKVARGERAVRLAKVATDPTIPRMARQSAKRELGLLYSSVGDMKTTEKLLAPAEETESHNHAKLVARREEIMSTLPGLQSELEMSTASITKAMTESGGVGSRVVHTKTQEDRDHEKEMKLLSIEAARVRKAGTGSTGTKSITDVNSDLSPTTISMSSQSFQKTVQDIANANGLDLNKPEDKVTAERNAREAFENSGFSVE